VIVFVPAHDAPTRSNHAVASELLARGFDPVGEPREPDLIVAWKQEDKFLALLGVEATRERLLDRLRHIERPLFAMASADVDVLADADRQLDVLEALQSLRDIWQLLRIWVTGAESAERHPHAPDTAPRSLLA
jgi:hypothetical protein